MLNYILKTKTTMKEYNNDKWWIDLNTVGEMSISAENVESALQKYKEIIKSKYDIEISNNAIKNKSPMYIDMEDGSPKQIGYVITGKTDFEKDGKWVPQYIDLWVRFFTIVDTKF